MRSTGRPSVTGKEATTGWLAVARITALTHLSFIVFLVVGGPISVRWPRVMPFHLAALGAAIAINLTGSDCPLTAIEQRLLSRSDHPVYEGGFISHYLVEPVHPAGINGAVNLVMLTVLSVPTSWSYSIVLRRRRRTTTSIRSRSMRRHQ